MICSFPFLEVFRIFSMFLMFWNFMLLFLGIFKFPMRHSVISFQAGNMFFISWKFSWKKIFFIHFPSIFSVFTFWTSYLSDVGSPEMLLEREIFSIIWASHSDQCPEGGQFTYKASGGWGMTAALINARLLLVHDLNMKRPPCQRVCVLGSVGNTGASCGKARPEASRVREKSD